MEHTQHSWERRGSASGQGCASSPWPDSRCLDTYSREARCKKKLIQPIAPVLPGEQLEGGGTACSSQGLCTSPLGGKPNQ